MVAVSVHLFGSDALATEDHSNWRSNYDLIMKWVNFAILVIVLVKFTGKPIMDFLRNQKDEVALEIKKIEKEKENVSEKIKAALEAMDQSNERFENLKDRIVEQGEREKQKIIEKAHEQSQIMLEGAKRKIDSQIQQASTTIRTEMVDAAISLAFEKLPKEINEEDNQKFIRLFLNNAATP